MNKAVTDGVVFNPPAFENGLNVWSSGDGTPGSPNYAGAPNAAFVPADQDFGGCLELQKTQSTQKLRYMGQTPILRGCYLRVRARVKVLAGSIPQVRIAAWAGTASGSNIAGATQVGPTVTPGGYGEVVEVSAIVGMGRRDGVEMSWGIGAAYGHFGLDLTGANGGVVRIDDFVIEDITSVFLRDMINVVDVRDYGAVGNGTHNDSLAFQAADANANGRKILVPEGTYYLADTVSLNSEVEFQGTVTMPRESMLLLLKNFSLPTYIEAFGNEEIAFTKAFQALLNNSDHESLDLQGRKVTITGPIDMQYVVPNKTRYETRRVIRNGQLEAASSSAWATGVATSVASYSTSDSKKLTNVTNVANIPVGALVQGVGVGREVYVRSKNVGAREITLSSPLYDAVGTQNFTFYSFKYMLDFSGFDKFSKFVLSELEIQCQGQCSGVRLAPSGQAFNMRDCHINRPLDRGVTSIGDGCQGMLIDQCQFLSQEDSLTVSNRKSIAMNANANDVKLRHNRATRFRHFAVLSGSNNIVVGNHLFQGDGVAGGVRTAGVVMAGNFSSSTLSDNYIDNCYVEWSNEHDSTPDFTGGFSFSAISITDNIFLAGNVAPWFSFIVIKPHGTGQFLNGMTVTGNKFRCMNGSITRAESVDTSFANLNFSRMKNVNFSENTYHNISQQPSNPLRLNMRQNSASALWWVPTNGGLPFGGRARGVDSIVVHADLVDVSNNRAHLAPTVRLERGSNGDQVDLEWSASVRGTVTALIRMDD